MLHFIVVVVVVFVVVVVVAAIVSVVVVVVVAVVVFDVVGVAADVVSYRLLIKPAVFPERKYRTWNTTKPPANTTNIRNTRRLITCRKFSIKLPDVSGSDTFMKDSS